MNQDLPKEIWAPHIAFYAESMKVNSTSAVRSIGKVSDVMRHVVESLSEDPLEDVETVDVLNELQNLLVQAGALSRYFWPARKEHKWRGEHLRRILNVKDDSALKDRDLRNELEHFDERLDAYLAQGVVGHVIPQYLGPEPGEQEVPLHLFRAYFINTGVFQLFGKRYAVVPIAKAVTELHRRLTGEPDLPNEGRDA